jgi:hypothetical protein
VKRIVLLGTIIAALGLAASASASGPVITTTELNQTTPVPNISCTDYGYSFDTLATFDVVRRNIDFYDDSGNLVKEIRHVDFTGTLYRTDDLSKTVPYAGTWTRTLDVAANTVTNTGLFRYSHPDGSGMVALDAGRSVLDATTFDTLSDTGPTEIGWEQAVCTYLAAE